jgi:3-phosphoshikimate 1-carboxyvinyltransferase
MVYEVGCLAGPVDAVLSLPGSKSYTNRALLLAALASGRSMLTGALFSDDTRYMCESLARLGVAVEQVDSEALMTVTGAGGSFPAAAAELYVGNAGTAARFLTAALTASSGRFVLDGSERMRERPIEPLLAALGELGARARSLHGTGCPPVLIDADGLPGGVATVDGAISSQYLSALLMVAPLARSDVTVAVAGELVSAPYVEMTMAIMRDFGARCERASDGRFHVPGQQAYTSREYAVEPDASSASYFFAAAAVTGGRVRVERLGSGSVQGDLGLLEVLERMGCSVVCDANWIEVQGPERLTGVDADFSRMGDVATTLLAIAPFADGPVSLRGIAQTHYEESDRPVAAATELRRMGIRVENEWDTVTVHPGRPAPTTVSTYDDHRIAMSFAVTGLAAPGIRIEDPGCVAKTFPSFFATLETLAPRRAA